MHKCRSQDAVSSIHPFLESVEALVPSDVELLEFFTIMYRVVFRQFHVSNLCPVTYEAGSGVKLPYANERRDFVFGIYDCLLKHIEQVFHPESLSAEKRERILPWLAAFRAIDQREHLQLKKDERGNHHLYLSTIAFHLILWAARENPLLFSQFTSTDHFSFPQPCQ